MGRVSIPDILSYSEAQFAFTQATCRPIYYCVFIVELSVDGCTCKCEYVQPTD